MIAASSRFPPPAPARLRTLAEMPGYLREQFARDVLLGRCRDGQDETLSTAEFCDRVEQVGAALIARGLLPGDRVAILSASRPEWLIVDLAALTIGAVTVPIYPTLGPAQIRYLLEDSGSRVMFASDLDQAAKVDEIRRHLPDLDGVVLFDQGRSAGAVATDRAADSGATTGTEAGADTRADAARRARGWVMSLADLERHGREALADGRGTRQEIRRRLKAVKPGDLATIIYTSGTTGQPKGVMLSHHNIVSNVVSCGFILGCSPADTALSFLPISHAFERTVIYIYLYEGVTIMFAEAIDTVARDLLRTRPTVMTGVPRVFEKLYARVMDTVSSAPAVRRQLVAWALAVGRAHARARFERGGAPFWLQGQNAAADRLVLATIRSRTGTDRVRVLVSGSAPLAIDVCRFFHALGLRLVEGYGLTETAPVLTVNPLDAPRVGTVGWAIPNVELAIAEDGEILARGPNVMLGYYKQPDATGDALSGGWFHTGDIGTLSQDGYLTITDRKKDLLITSGGKHVAPQPIERALTRSALVAEAILVGDRRPFISVLLVPDFAQVEARLAGDVDPRNREATCDRADVRAMYQRVVDEVNEGLAPFERVKRFALLPTELTVTGGELTPSLKVRRNIVVERWQNVIDALYRGDKG